MASELIIRENDEMLDELDLLFLNDLQPIDFPLVHRFTDGMYIREIFMPKGSLLTSKIHKTNHPYTISKGRAAVSIDGKEWHEYEAPYTGITQAGTRRILYILEDCVWTTYHCVPMASELDNELDEESQLKLIDIIEDEIIEKHINSISGNNVNDEYKKILSNNKNELLWHG